MKQLLARINQFSKGDFLGEEPYKLLEEFSGSDFNRAQLQLVTEQRAKDVGFGCFKRMYTAYSKTHSNQKVGIDSEACTTAFPGQPLELACPGWSATAKGIFRTDSNGNQTPVCAHPIIPIARLIDIDTNETHIKLSYCLPGRIVWSDIIVAMDTIATTRNITTLAKQGISVTSNNASLLVAYLHDLIVCNAASIPTYMCVSRLGYFPQYGFAPYTQNLCYNEQDHIRLYRAICTYGSETTWYKTILEYRKESIPAKIMLAASFASPLLSVVGSLPFFVHLWSTMSGNGKTVALLVAASVWGNPAAGHYVQSHNGTQVGLERTAAFLNHLPTCLDELQLAKDGHGRISIDVYPLAEGIGRLRGNKDGGVDITPTWQCCFLSTGETPITQITSGAGAINRVIDLPCPSDSYVVRDGRKYADAVRNNYGFAGQLFVDKLYQSDGVLSQAREIYAQNLDQLYSAGVADKQAMAGAAILTADQLATRWIFKDDNELTVEDIVPYLAQQNATSLGQDAYESLCNWVSLNINRFLHDDHVPSGDVYGQVDDGIAYINPAAFARAMQDQAYNVQAVKRYLRDKQLIKTRDSNGYTIAKRIPGSPKPTEHYALLLPDKETDTCMMPP